jgi:hypothetical protein
MIQSKRIKHRKKHLWPWSQGLKLLLVSFTSISAFKSMFSHFLFTTLALLAKEERDVIYKVEHCWLE